MTTPTDTTFVSGTTITSSWLNGVNDAIFDMYGETQYNLYVSVTGNDSNDGLTVSTPFATLQKAFDTLSDIGNVGGRRTINIAAGTYNTVANRKAKLGPGSESEIDPDADQILTGGVSTVNYVLIQGPDVGYDPLTNPWPTPTVIFDGGGVSGSGLQIESGSHIKVLVKNIKFINYNGNSSSSGLANVGGYLRCENVHTSNCIYGINSFYGKLFVRGGDIYGNAAKAGYTGIRSLFINYHSIGYQGAGGAGQGPRIRYCQNGLISQESSVGHSDSVSYEDCTYGILATVNSRVNFAYSDFKRCTRAIRVENNSVVQDNYTAEFHVNTADASSETVAVTSGAVWVDRDSYFNSVRASDYTEAPITVTGNTTNNIILQRNINQGEFTPLISSIRKPMHIEGVVFGRFDAALLDNVQFKIRLANSPGTGGAAAGFTIYAASVTTTDSFVFRFSCVWTAANVQYLSIDGSVHLYPNTLADYSVGSEDMRLADKTFTLEIQPLNAADSITVHHAHFKLVG